MYKVIFTESHNMQRLFSPKVVIVFRSQSWEVLTCHSLLWVLHTWQCWAFSAVQYKVPQMQNASTCHLQMRIKVTSFLGACLSAIRPVQFGDGCMKIESWLKPCLKSSCDKWNIGKEKKHIWSMPAASALRWLHVVPSPTSLAVFPRQCGFGWSKHTSLVSRCMLPILEKPQFDFLTDT